MCGSTFRVLPQGFMLLSGDKRPQTHTTTIDVFGGLFVSVSRPGLLCALRKSTVQKALVEGQVKVSAKNGFGKRLNTFARRRKGRLGRQIERDKVIDSFGRRTR
jgi:hypothetical protein